MRRSGTRTVSATGVDVSFKARIIRKMLGFGAAFFQTGVVRVFAEKDFVHMRSCRNEFLVFRDLASGYLFHDLISGYWLGLCVLLSPTLGTTERDSSQ